MWGCEDLISPHQLSLWFSETRLDRKAHTFSPWLSVSPSRRTSRAAISRAAGDPGISIRMANPGGWAGAHTAGEEPDLD